MYLVAGNDACCNILSLSTELFNLSICSLGGQGTHIRVPFMAAWHALARVFVGPCTRACVCPLPGFLVVGCRLYVCACPLVLASSHRTGDCLRLRLSTASRIMLTLLWRCLGHSLALLRRRIMHLFTFLQQLLDFVLGHTLCPGHQRPRLSGGGSSSLASGFDARGSLGQGRSGAHNP